MTQTGNAPQNDPVVERARFRDWTNRVIAGLRVGGNYTIEDIAKAGGVDPGTIYTWKRKGDEWPDGRPRPETVMKFCANLDLDPFEPFEILGWMPRGMREPQPVMPQLARDLARFLLDPNVDPDEKRLVETFLVRMIGPHRHRPPEDAA